MAYGHAIDPPTGQAHREQSCVMEIREFLCQKPACSSVSSGQKCLIIGSAEYFAINPLVVVFTIPCLCQIEIKRFLVAYPFIVAL